MRSVLLMLCVAVSLEAAGEVVVAGREGGVSATVLTGLDTRPEGILMWRGMLQWFGGVGIIGVRIGMQLASPLAVGLLDLLGRGLPRHTEQLVEVGHQPPSPM